MHLGAQHLCAYIMYPGARRASAPIIISLSQCSLRRGPILPHRSMRRWSSLSPTLSTLVTLSDPGTLCVGGPIIPGALCVGGSSSLALSASAAHHPRRYLRRWPYHTPALAASVVPLSPALSASVAHHPQRNLRWRPIIPDAICVGGLITPRRYLRRWSHYPRRSLRRWPIIYPQRNLRWRSIIPGVICVGGPITLRRPLRRRHIIPDAICGGGPTIPGALCVGSPIVVASIPALSVYVAINVISCITALPPRYNYNYLITHSGAHRCPFQSSYNASWRYLSASHHRHHTMHPALSSSPLQRVSHHTIYILAAYVFWQPTCRLLSAMSHLLPALQPPLMHPRFLRRWHHHHLTHSAFSVCIDGIEISYPSGVLCVGVITAT
jgi:hypothetical protein